MAPGQDLISASPAILLPARHPPQQTSLFLATVAPEAVLAHLLVYSQLHFPDVSGLSVTTCRMS